MTPGRHRKPRVPLRQRWHWHHQRHQARQDAARADLTMTTAWLAQARIRFDGDTEDNGRGAIVSTTFSDEGAS